MCVAAYVVGGTRKCRPSADVRMFAVKYDAGMPPDLEGTLLRIVLTAFTASEPMSSGAEALLHNLAAALGLSAGVLWMPTGRLLVTQATWAAERTEQHALEKSAVKLTVTTGKGLAGAAWELREPQFAATAGAAELCAVSQSTSRALRGMVAVPARVQDEVLGVVELYAGHEDELSYGRSIVNALRPSAHLLGSLLDRWSHQATQPKLTGREIELLTLASNGTTTPQIADLLTLSPWTVKTHFENIRLKLDVSDRAAAVAVALRTGIIA